jgi:activating signal cointegrator 1
MKCLSLWQPWATLMEIGAKRNETRSWETLHRGPLAIHAAKKWTRELSTIACAGPFSAALLRQDDVLYISEALRRIPFGCILCVVDLIDCVRITATNAPAGDEYAFGDYTPGRFMWHTANLRRLPTPIPYRGAQGLFEIPDDLLNTDVPPEGRIPQPSPALTPREGFASKSQTQGAHHDSNADGAAA